KRIALTEELFLEKKFGPAFVAWAGQTPAFIPKLAHWRPAELGFSWRTALKREYLGFFAIISTFFFLEIAGDYFATKKIIFDSVWVVIWLVSLAFFGVARILKKRSSFLSVAGR